jgi:hypothetical protein
MEEEEEEEEDIFTVIFSFIHSAGSLEFGLFDRYEHNSVQQPYIYVFFPMTFITILRWFSFVS